MAGSWKKNSRIFEKPNWWTKQNRRTNGCKKIVFARINDRIMQWILLFLMDYMWKREIVLSSGCHGTFFNVWNVCCMKYAWQLVSVYVYSVRTTQNKSNYCVCVLSVGLEWWKKYKKHPKITRKTVLDEFIFLFAKKMKLKFIFVCWYVILVWL